jgi:hypothetical protein
VITNFVAAPPGVVTPVGCGATISPSGGGNTEVYLGANATTPGATLGVGNNHFYIKNISFRLLGALAHFEAADGVGLVLADSSSNKHHAVLSGTVNHLVPQLGPARIRRTSSTNGNEQFFGQACIPGNSQILRVRARAQTGTPSVTLGTTSGPRM